MMPKLNKSKIRTTIFIFSIFLIPIQTEAQTTTTIQHESVESTILQIKDRLKDPSSVQFRNIYINSLKTGATSVCGELNAKNSFGGYTGFNAFYQSNTDKEPIIYSESDSNPDKKKFKAMYFLYCNKGTSIVKETIEINQNAN